MPSITTPRSPLATNIARNGVVANRRNAVRTEGRTATGSFMTRWRENNSELIQSIPAAPSTTACAYGATGKPTRLNLDSDLNEVRCSGTDVGQADSAAKSRRNGPTAAFAGD